MTSELHYSPATNAPPRPGVFIVFEGGDGSGKSTQARILETRIREEIKCEVLLTREPGGTEIGERIRSLVLEQGQGQIDARTEALLYAASRSAHTHQVIAPALERGAIVVCDRYIDSSAAYQGAGRGLGERPVTELSRWATENLLPDLTIFLSLGVSDARRRVTSRGAADRLEAEPDSFHARVRDSFHALAQSTDSARVTVNGGGEIDDVADRVWNAVAPVLTAGEPR
ncbi:dTMP kinase [Kocuria sp. TGY1127_2]|uniref:dTMP kinase n=1 Tax=Kocuria sp. TGY1127_2 TaxID=2711328 RepID=UPI0015BE45D4|nr:dTMP kinase [Kocuria sp. TGY1127_2]